MKSGIAKTNGTRSRGASRRGQWVSDEEFSRLRSNLAEAQETLEAIRSGTVDAVVVNGPNGNQIYSLTGADEPYRVYVERMQEGAATISDAGLILYTNQRFAEMVRQPLERVIGTEASRYLDVEAWEKIFSVFASKQDVIRCETVLRCPDDATLPVKLTASHLPLQGQNVLCLVVTDLSAQKQNEELRLAKEVAERASLAKDAFLATLSHELRTPLSPVLLLASEAAEDTTLPAQTRAQFATIRNNIESEARLIDDLLDLTRITHGKLALNLNLISCHDVLNNAIATVKSDLDQKQISLTLDFEKRPGIMKADAFRLQQVFWNVLKNAVKFTAEKGKIKITTRTIPDQNQFAVTISDTGMGMTQEEIGHIFETFAQGDHAKTSRSHQFGGLGLGLSISRMLITMHAGRIEAYSEGRGKGSTLYIELPLANRSAAPQFREQPQFETQNNANHAGKCITILLVEDHESTRNALKHLLTRRRHTVISAATADEARALAGKHKFDLIVSDIGLPDGSGLDLMRELNARYDLKGIALTGYGMDHDIISSRESGFLTHLTKPVHIQSLDKALSMAMAD